MFSYLVLPFGTAFYKRYKLLVDSGNNAGAYGTATLTDSETQANLDSDGGNQLNAHLGVIGSAIAAGVLMSLFG